MLYKCEKSNVGLFCRHSVLSVHWSSNVGETMCYLSVVHGEHVSIWKVSGLVPKLSFKQVRKLNVQPIPQGICVLIMITTFKLL